MARIKDNIVAYWGMDENLNDELGNNNGTLHVDATAYYPFNGNANDESDNSNDGVVDAGIDLTTDRFGVADKAYAWDTDNTRVTIGLGTQSGDFTFSTWLNIISYSAYGASNGNNGLIGHATALASGRISFLANASSEIGIRTSLGQVDFTLGDSMPTNEWYHLVITRDSNVVSIYKNGVLLTTSSDAKLAGTIDFDILGDNPTDSSWKALNGKMDEVLILNKSLNANEVASLYELTSRHDLNDIYVDGKVGKGIDILKPVYVSVGTIGVGLSTSFSLGGWVKLRTYGSGPDREDQRTIIGGRHGDNLTLSINPTGTVNFRRDDPEVTSVGVVPLDTWTHVFVTYEVIGDGNVKSDIYINGVLDKTNTAPLYSPGTTTNMWIGWDSRFLNYFDGELDEVCVFNKALSQEEVSRIYNSGTGSKYPIDFAVNIGIDGYGTVTKDPDKDYYLYDESLTLTPVPTLGSIFTEWKGDITSETSVQTFNIAQEYDLTSEFYEYPRLKSKSIYLDTVPATKARLTISTTSDVSNFILGVSNDAGITFEECTNNVDKIFVDSSGNEVQYSIWGKVPGTKITKAIVKIN